MKFLYKLGLILLSIFINGCFHSEDDTMIFLKPKSESEILPNIHALSSNENFFVGLDSKMRLSYIYDYRLQKVNRINHCKTLISIGFAEDIFLIKNNIYILDSFHNSIKSYDFNGNSINTVNLAEKACIGSFCVINNNDISYYVHSIDKYPILVFNKNGNLSNEFGKFYNDINSLNVKKSNNLLNFILPFQDGVLSINGQHAVFDYYDLNGNLLNHYFSEDMENFITDLKLNNKSPLKDVPGSALSYIVDCKIKDEFLYILLTRPLKSPDKRETNNIAIINLKNFTKNYKVIKLPGKFYEAIAISRGNLVAYNIEKSKLQLFTLPKNQ